MKFLKRKSDERNLEGLHPNAVRILRWMQARSRDGKFVSSQDEIAAAVGLSPVTVRKHLSALRDIGYLGWNRRCRAANVYVLDRKSPFVQASDLYSGNGLVGVADVIKSLKEQAAKGRHLLLYSPEGLGKTALLEKLRSTDGWTKKEKIFVTDGTPCKVFLTQVAEGLGLNGNIARMTTNQLKDAVIQELAKRDVVLICDNLDRVTSAQRSVLEKIMQYAQIIAACSHKRDVGLSFWRRFKEINLKPLHDEAIAAIIDRFFMEEGKDILIAPEDSSLLKKSLIAKVKGNPRDLMTELNRIKDEGEVDRDYIQKELGAEQENGEIGLIVVLITAIVMSVRYLGLGLNDIGLYVIAGLGYAFFYVLRFFTMRMSSKNKKKGGGKK